MHDDFEEAAESRRVLVWGHRGHPVRAEERAQTTPPRGGSTSAQLPSLPMLSGMRWIFCSLTQELVNICSSTDVSEAVLTPEETTGAQQERPGGRGRPLCCTGLTFLLLLLDQLPPFCSLIIGGHQEAVGLDTRQGGGERRSSSLNPPRHYQPPPGST